MKTIVLPGGERVSWSSFRAAMMASRFGGAARGPEGAYDQAPRAGTMRTSDALSGEHQRIGAPDQEQEQEPTEGRLSAEFVRATERYLRENGISETDIGTIMTVLSRNTERPAPVGAEDTRRRRQMAADRALPREMRRWPTQPMSRPATRPGSPVPRASARSNVPAPPVEAPVRSPEREALATAIARRAAAVDRLDRAERALARAGEMGREAYSDEQRAETALVDARAGEDRWLADALLADGEPGTSPIRTAEAALAKAREQREAAGNASTALRQQVERDRVAVDYARQDVRRAAAQVLGASPATEAAIERLERAEAELVEAGDQMLWLCRVGAIDIERAPDGGWRADATDMRHRARSAARRLEAPPIAWHELIRQAAGTAEWEAVLVALTDDADTPCPGERE
jgi:hypothetical protein